MATQDLLMITLGSTIVTYYKKEADILQYLYYGFQLLSVENWFPYKEETKSGKALLYHLLCPWFVSHVVFTYHIAQNFDRGKFWHFWWFPATPSKFNLSIFKKHYSVYRCMVKDSDRPSKYFPSNVWKVSMHQNFPRQSFALYGMSSHLKILSGICSD